MKTNVERSVSASNKKPGIKVDVMDPFINQAANSRMPARQKSMIDLRDPTWDPARHHQMMMHGPGGHLGGGGLARHGHGGTPPRNGGPPPPPQASRQQRPPMMRSATEHDIKIRNRRSMAVGPFEDLPPHIRQHMV